MNMKATAVIVAAGSSTRMGCPKLLLPLGGRPVLWHTLQAFDRSCVSSIVAVIREEDRSLVQEWAATLQTPCYLVVGGATRQQSVANGMALVGDASLVAIADGARPLITPDQIDRVIAVAAETKAAAAAVRVKDTIKQASADGIIVATPDRAALWQVQTPQVFDTALYREAMANAAAQGLDLTDDCQLVERIGAQVTLVECSYENLKITTPEDIPAARAILAQRGWGGMRIGHGYDVHKFSEDRRLILGGVDIPFEMGLLGHSDADVLTHAIMDALCGAARLGDIGGLFPDTDPTYKGADSIMLLRHVTALVRDKGFSVENIDATVLCQRPKLKPHIAAMQAILAEAIGVELERINVKATTEEGLGFTGAMEGIAAHAVVLLT